MVFMNQKVYFSNTPLSEAIQIFLDEIHKRGIVLVHELISVTDSLGRVTAAPVFAKVSSPNFTASAMDGIAVKASSTFGATETEHKVLELNKDFMVVDTGDPIPKNFDSVIMVEHIIKLDNERVEITAGAAPWQNIRPIGEDIVAGELIVPVNHKIRPVDIGALLAGGITEIEVYKKPSVGIIPTGTELVEPSDELKEGDLIEYNSRIFSAMVTEWGGKPVRYEIVKDDQIKIKNTLEEAVKKNDIVIINAGSSAGREDYSLWAVEELGEVVIHGISAKPGKPVILGFIKNKPIIGVPGYPVSAFFIMEYFVKPLLEGFNNQVSTVRNKVQAVFSRRVVSSLKNQEFIRIKLGKVGDKLIATPLNRGAGVVMSLVRADGLLIIPQNCEGIEAGSIVDVELLKSVNEIQNSILCIGSHDPILDILADKLHEKYPDTSLASTHIGSMGGIMALKKGETHFATIHLLDEETGEYNKSYIEKYLGDKNIKLVKFVKRVQGFMVQNGNPKNIKDFNDLARDDVKYINRQRGAGTRILLDYELKKRGIDTSKVNGYEREESTHLGVAAAVQAGSADCGLGVYSAAKIFNLDFISVCNEEYDIAIPEEFLGQENIKKLFEVIRSDEFRKEVEKLGGYEFNLEGM